MLANAVRLSVLCMPVLTLAQSTFPGVSAEERMHSGCAAPDVVQCVSVSDERGEVIDR